MPLHSNARLFTKCCLAFVIFLSSMPCMARAFGQTVTFSGKNVPLTKVFAAIEDQTHYGVFVDHKLLAEMKNVSLEVKDATIQDVLQQCLAAQSVPLEFFIQGTTITIVKKKVVVKEKEGPAGPQEFRGTVLGQDGRPLVGATVLLKGLNRSGVTNEDGEFILHEVPNGKYRVEVSFVGYDKTETYINVVDHQVRITVEMRLGMNNLDAPVVKGYYSTTKRLNTGDVTTVKGEDIQKQPVTDPILALEGRVPGLYVQQTSGVPGAYSTIRLRGQNSIANGNDPLYIVDGVPYSSQSPTNSSIGGGALGSPGNGNGQGMSPFDNLVSSDIESIEILKDADATAIYGSRGANGVILITTKKGKSGAASFFVNANTGMGKVTRTWDMMNTTQYLQMRREAYSNDKITNIPSNAYDINGTWDTTRYTDWQKVLIGGTAHLTSAQASLSGGNSNTNFLIGAAYSRQTTVFPGSQHSEKSSAHFNLSHVSADQKLHVLFSGNYIHLNSNLPQIDFTSLITLAPDAPAIYDQAGNINWQKNTWNNPFAVLLKSARASNNNVIGNLSVSYELLQNLQAKCSFGYTHMETSQSIQTPGTAIAPPNNNNPTRRTNFFSNGDINTWIIEPQLNYNKKFGQHRVEALVGSTIQKNNQNSIGQYAYGFSSDAQLSNIASASSLLVLGSNDIKYRYSAFFARLSYAFNERYLINMTGRRDGSSRFGPGRQFGSFGSIGAAWIFSKEKFIQNNLSFLSFGKLRGSYGSTGNDQIPDYQFLNTYTSTGLSYQGLGGIYPTQLTNPDFAWEVVKKLEVGLELGMLRDRVFISASYYRNRTGNQLVGYNLPSPAGFTTVLANLPAVIQNTGIELVLNASIIKGKSFSWSSMLNATIPRNKLVSYPNLEGSPYNGVYVIGQPLSMQLLRHNIGVDKTTGLYAYEDANHDGQISFPEEYFPNAITQKFYGGIENSFSYKGFQVDFLFQFVKQNGFNYLNSFNQVGVVNKNVPTYYLARWRQAGDQSDIQKFSTKNSANPADAAIGDASFIRLKNISLSYSFSPIFLKKAHMQGAKVYLLSQNLFTFTKYKGLDPETRGLSLPPIRMITGGIQFTF